jgi:hypothetical protein
MLFIKKSLLILLTLLNATAYSQGTKKTIVKPAPKEIRQREIFDLASFYIPEGAQKEASSGSFSMTIFNKALKSYYKIIVYKSINSSGNLSTDFNNDWQSLVANPYKIAELPVSVNRPSKSGWNVQAGKSKFTFNNQETFVELITYSGYATVVSMVAITNHSLHFNDIDNFLDGITFQTPEVVNHSTIPENKTLPPSKNNEYQYIVSHFDDGWVSAVEKEWVKVTKNDVHVYLFYAMPYNSDNFSGTGIMERDYYWDNNVSKYFNIQSKQYRDDGEFVAAFKPKYVEGVATEKQSGQKRFLAMTVQIAPNTAYLTLVSAPDESTFRNWFPKANDRYSSDLSAMSRYNKFAIGPNDISGTWQNGNTSTMQWVYETPSGYEGYAGMTLAASSATFQFHSNGTYNSIHNGATGAVGNMNTFQQEFKGNYTASNWMIKATNRYGGKTDQFDASYTAIRGGRVLKLNNNAGQEYNLIKVK